MKAVRWLRRYGILIGVILLVLFSMWWYGVFPEIGKTDEEYLSSDESAEDIVYRYQMEAHGADEETLAEIDRQILKHEKKGISRMSTKSLIATMLNMGMLSSGNSPYFAPEIAYDYRGYLDEMSLGEDSYIKFAYEELCSRGKGGKELVKMYRSYLHHILGPDADNSFGEGKLSMIELLLAQPEMRLHLTPEDLCLLKETAYQVQWEKVFGYQTGYNLLDRETYDENGWKEDLVTERMQYFGRLREGMTWEEVESYVDSLPQKKWQKKVDAETHSRLQRFDDCRTEYQIGESKYCFPSR